MQSRLQKTPSADFPDPTRSGGGERTTALWACLISVRLRDSVRLVLRHHGSLERQNGSQEPGMRAIVAIRPDEAGSLRIAGESGNRIWMRSSQQVRPYRPRMILNESVGR